MFRHGSRQLRLRQAGAAGAGVPRQARDIITGSPHFHDWIFFLFVPPGSPAAFRSDVLPNPAAILQILPAKHIPQVVLFCTNDPVVDGDDEYSQQDDERVCGVHEEEIPVPEDLPAQSSGFDGTGEYKDRGYDPGILPCHWWR
jgi:hypothetical protein